MKERHHLELAEFFLLDHLSRDNLSPGEIAVEMEIPAHAVSRKLDTLERLGFMTRTLDPEDSRRRVLSITSEGRYALEDARATLHREVKPLLAVLTSQQLEKVTHHLERIAHREEA